MEKSKIENVQSKPGPFPSVAQPCGPSPGPLALLACSGAASPLRGRGSPRPCSWAAVGPPGGRHDQLDFFPSSLDNFRICRFRGKFLKRGVKEVIRSNSSGNKGLVLSI